MLFRKKKEMLAENQRLREENLRLDGIIGNLNAQVDDLINEIREQESLLNQGHEMEILNLKSRIKELEVQSAKLVQELKKYE